MTAADDAYAEAKRLIAEAKAEGSANLNFNFPKTHALSHIPEEIANLQALRQLSLNNTQITSLAPLTQLTGLTTLFLNNTQITDFDPFTQLTGLTMLSLDNTQITDLAPLTGLIGLTTLALYNTRITDFDPLTQLTGLTTLYLSNTKITELAPLTQLTGLTTLHLNNTQITDFAPLSQLNGLNSLSLNKTRITDLAPLTQLTGLTSLTLSKSAVFDLRPLRTLSKLAEKPRSFGLTFKNIPATRADPRIAEIAEIEDPATRARELFAYLENWVPPGEVPLLGEATGFAQPGLPISVPAPVVPLLTDNSITLAKGPAILAASNAVLRAQDGWLALSEFRESFGSSFHLENYAPLPAILKCFDRAMGNNYASCRPIAAGMHGQRIIALSGDKGFLETLPTGAEPELKAFAAAIATFVERFPDWQEYSADSYSETEDGITSEDREAFAAVDQVIADTPQADEEFKEEFHAIVSLGSAEQATEAEIKGLDTSTRELARALSERALLDVRSGGLAKRQAAEMAQVGQSEWPKWKYRLGGFSLHALHHVSPSLRLLAKQRPKQFGWVTPILDYFGTP